MRTDKQILGSRDGMRERGVDGSYHYIEGTLRDGAEVLFGHVVQQEVASVPSYSEAI